MREPGFSAGRGLRTRVGLPARQVKKLCPNGHLVVTGVRIDSARASGGAGRTSDFAARLDRFGTRNGLFEAKELVVLSDGAA